MTEVGAVRYLARQRTAIDRALARHLPPGRDPLRRALRHSLLAPGKRVRPLLTVATAAACRVPATRLMPFACAIELVHTYSLVHDDLPAMDDDDVRRGRPTSHKVFGEGLAILVGDALLTEAFGLMARASRVPADRRVAAIGELARAAGEAGMVGGQALDLAAEGQSPSLARVRNIHRKKTGALLAASVRIGGLVAGASRCALRRLDEYGRELGLAFQITDDILDAADRASEDGRTDRALGKATYPARVGLQASGRHARRAGDAAVAALDGFGPTAMPLRVLAARVVDRVADLTAS